MVAVICDLECSRCWAGLFFVFYCCIWTFRPLGVFFIVYQGFQTQGYDWIEYYFQGDKFWRGNKIRGCIIFGWGPRLM